MTIEAMKKLVAAVEAIPEDVEGWMPDALTDALIDAKKSIAEAEKQELVALVSKTPPLYPMQKEGETFSVEYCEINTQPKREWVGLTDEDRQAAFESLPDMLDGFLKKWGWLHFSKAIEAKLKEKNT